MKLSRRVARFNKVINNRVQGTYAWLVPPWVVILHRGRRSGRRYRTPVLAFRRGQTLTVALLYGEESDWLRNLQAGEGHVIRAGRTFQLRDPHVVDTRDAAELRALSPPARWYCRLAEKQVTLQIGERQPGFGPRCRSDWERESTVQSRGTRLRDADREYLTRAMRVVAPPRRALRSARAAHD